MGTHPKCDIEVGVHPGPFWIDNLTGLKVCSRHRDHYEEDLTYGPFQWAINRENEQ